MSKARPLAKALHSDVVSVEQITDSIRVFRGHKVLLDAEVATLYGVATARLNQQVRRNLERFPEDFMFQLTAGGSGLHQSFTRRIASLRAPCF